MLVPSRFLWEGWSRHFRVPLLEGDSRGPLEIRDPQLIMVSTSQSLNDDDVQVFQPEFFSQQLNQKNQQESVELLKHDGGEETIEWNDDGAEEEDGRINLGLVGKIWTKRNINTNTFMFTMKNIWQPMHGVDISSIGDNTFMFQFHHWRDKNSVVEGHPWHFDKHDTLFDDVQGKLKQSEMNLYQLPMWVRIYNLPFKGR